MCGWNSDIMSLTHKAISSIMLGMSGFDPSFTPIVQVISIRKIGKIIMEVRYCVMMLLA